MVTLLCRIGRFEYGIAWNEMGFNPHKISAARRTEDVL
jgi:hypothetical protein